MPGGGAVVTSRNLRRNRGNFCVWRGGLSDTTHQTASCLNSVIHVDAITRMGCSCQNNVSCHRKFFQIIKASRSIDVAENDRRT